ncbi:MAG: ATP-binding protein [Burkholderiales bacterium]
MAQALRERDGQPAAADERGGFRLLRWFALLSLLCVLCAGAGTAFFLSRFLSDQMLERDAAVSAEFVDGIVRAQRSWSYFSTPSTAAHDALDPFFNYVAHLPGVVRANVYAADGTMLWSSNAELIGRRFAGNSELDRALAGRLVLEAGSVDEQRKAEHIALDEVAGRRRFVEAYLPIWDEARRSVIGVVEIYCLPDGLFHAVDKGVRLVWLSAGLGMALLYAALFWLAARAQHAMAQQQRRLVESEALAAIGAVASAVAHGIRNPLASIRSSAELAATEDPALARECMADIQRETDRVEEWVRDLLLQAKGESILPQAVDVNLLLADAVCSFGPLAERQGVRVASETADVPAVRANPGALGQAIDNLVANAIEAMPDGGELRLSSGIAASGREVEIRVADSGGGIPAPLAEGNGRMFFSTKPRGTGLGLVLTRRIVARYAGSLRLEAALGQGTIATVRLPVAG